MLRCHVDMRAYCGMSYRITPAGADRDDARDAAARYLRRKRAQGRQVCTLEKGSRWEIMEPEGCLMVPDDAGTLALVEVWTCDDCRRPIEAGADDTVNLCERCSDARWEAESEAECEDA